MGRQRQIPATPVTPPVWRLSAACRGRDSAPFFLPARAEEARAVCRSCEVRAECLEFALATRPAGVWGGTTEEERRLLRRRKRERVVA